jgi:hypothetical protein
MAIFTKTFVRCDACEEEHELPKHQEGEWFHIRTEVRKLNEVDGEPQVRREADFCPRCYEAVRESEFSMLFEPTTANGSAENKDTPASSVVPLRD